MSRRASEHRRPLAAEERSEPGGDRQGTLSPRTGRRAGPTLTREAILVAARRRFADRGYDRATIRGIAADAGVDPAMLRHFFGSKEQLFVAAMRLPAVPGEVLSDLAKRAGRDRADLGEVLLRTVLDVWETPEGQAAVLGLLRSAVSNERAAAMLREFVSSAILGRIVAVLDTRDAAYRTSLVASQIVGLAIARYVIRLEPLASVSRQNLVLAVAPNLQRYLTGDLPGTTAKQAVMPPSSGARQRRAAPRG